MNNEMQVLVKLSKAEYLALMKVLLEHRECREHTEVFPESVNGVQHEFIHYSELMWRMSGRHELLEPNAQEKETVSS